MSGIELLRNTSRAKNGSIGMKYRILRTEELLVSTNNVTLTE